MHKIADCWKAEPYFVVKKMGELPVYENAPEVEYGPCKVVRGNLFLPIRELHGPGQAEVEMPPNRPQSP